MKKAATAMVFLTGFTAGMIFTGFTAGMIFTGYKIAKFALETDQIREGVANYVADRVSNVVFTNGNRKG